MITALEIKNKIDNFNNCKTQRSWKMSEREMIYENNFLLVVRLDSSNKWVGPNEMEKMWSVIFKPKKNFTVLKNYQELKKHLCMRITKVKRGKIAGYYGLRIYGMKKDPVCEIIKLILDFICTEETKS